MASIPLEVGPVIRERLAAEGVHNLNQWRRLGRRRFAIFGITRAMARKLDALARRRP